MKLRIRGNSVRIRVTRSEVDRLGNGMRVEQSTRFGPSSSLETSVVPSTLVSAPSAEYKDGSLTIHLPALETQIWAQSDQVSFEATQDAGSGESLRILIEKDFECVHSRAEGDDDAFPNPRLRYQKLDPP